MTLPRLPRPGVPDDITVTERFTQAVLPMAVVSVEGTLTVVNDAFCALLGRSPEELVGSRATQLTVDQSEESAAAVSRAVLAGEVGGEVDHQLRTASGDVVDVQVAWTVLRDDDGRCSYLTLVLVDVTEQRRQQAALARSEARFRARFERSAVPQIAAGVDGVITAANPAFCTLVGRTADEVIGRSITTLTHEQDRGRADAHLALVLAGEADSAHYERVLADVTGQPVPVVVDVTLLRDDEGRPAEAMSILRDLRSVRSLERRREEQEQLLAAVTTRASDVALVADVEGRIRYVSEAAQHMYGYDPSQVVAQLGWEYIHPDDVGGAQAAYDKVVDSGGTDCITFRVHRADGAWRWVEATVTNLLHTAIEGMVANLQDVTERIEAEQALRESEERYRLIADTAQEGIWAVAPDGTTLYANARMAAMLGLPLSELYARPLPSLLQPREAAEMTRRLRAREGGGPERYEIRYLHPDGGTRRFWVAATPMAGPDGVHRGSLGMVSDVTELRRTEEQLRRAALHDALTGLPNRTLLRDRLHQALARQEVAAAGGTAVLLLDLDDFKLVNDSRGHDVGDSLLVAVGERLLGSARSLDTVARFGGDEFVVVCEDVDEHAAMALADQLLRALREPFVVDGHVLHVNASVGVALSPASPGEDLLRFADAAMYSAKRSGRGRVVLFDPALADEAEHRYALAADLRVAVETDRLRMNYQPVVDLTSGRVTGMEALARWEHPVAGEVPPGRFVAVAEQTGLAVQLDVWALRRATHDTAALRARGVIEGDVGVAVNLSARSLVHPQLEQEVVAAVEAAGLPPQLVTLEITESAVMEDAALAVQVLRRLRDRGFGVAVDDFGTGYSSLAYLRDLPITSIKIDRSFVAGIAEDRDALAIAASIVDLARAIDVSVVAEGVESPEQAELLRRLGCPSAQGWLWSPALDLEQLEQVSGTWRSGYPVGASRSARVLNRQADAWTVRREHGGERLLQLHREGASLTTIAAALNSEGFRTPAGARWHRTTVARTVAQAAYPELSEPSAQ